MPAGIEVYNDSGFFQIDSTYTNFRLTSTQTFSFPGAAGAPPELFAGIVTTAISGNTPLVAIRSSVLCSVAMIRTITPTTFLVKVTASDAGPGSFTMYVFDQSPPTPGNCGLQVWDGGGKQVYDSNDKSLRVLDIYKQGNVYPGAVSSRSYPGKTVAVVVGGMLRYLSGTSPPSMQWEQLLGVRTPSSSQVDRGFFIYRRYFASTTQGYVSSRTVTDLVVDVTGY